MFHFPQNLIPCMGKLKQEKDLQKATKIKFYFGKIKPAWYQELSDRQMNAADNLQNSIQEDVEQGTVHRCQKILHGIGIKPIESSKYIRIVLQLCRGSDLAFLWFILNINAEENPTENRTDYSLNERLLLSAICHLDMITTLRQLDKKLPTKPIASTEENVIRKSRPRNHHTITKHHSISPYLEPCPRPKIPQSLYLPPIPPLSPNFAPYHIYKDSIYAVPNESNSNRWFAIPTFTGEYDRTAIVKQLCKSIDDQKSDEKITNILNELKLSTNCLCKDSRHYKKHEPLENDIIFPIDLDTIDTEEEFTKFAIAYQKQCMLRIIFRQLIHLREIADMNNMHLCMNCDDCRSDLKLYEKMAKKNYNLDIDKMCSTRKQLIDYEKLFTDSLIGKIGSFSKRCRKFVRSLDKCAKKRNEFISICPKEIWKYELRLWSELLFEQKYDKSVDNVPINQYNGSDTLLLTSVLKNTFIELSANPKYILASLPESYKLPLLQEWIKLRYGLTYSQEERINAIRISRKQWGKLLREDLNVRVSTPFDVANTEVVHYGYRNRIKNCINVLNEAYYNRLSVALVNDCRRFWITMKPHLCANSSLREMFYAYLPACENDVLPFRPWKVHEYRHPINYDYCSEYL